MLNIPIEYWSGIFKSFHQVQSVRIEYNTDSLEIKIKGREIALIVTKRELDESLSKTNNNPHDAATCYLIDHRVIVHYKNTLVGFFDIHAYSDYIITTSMEESIGTVSDLFLEIKSFAETDIAHVKIDHWILSDSIILVIDTNRQQIFNGNLKLFFAVCSTIMMDSMMKGFPLRGAIGGGNFYKDSDIMVSTGLVDAAFYEKEQDWLGAVLTPNALKLIEIAGQNPPGIDLSTDAYTPFLRYGKIPWKKKGRSLEKPEKTYFVKPHYISPVANWMDKLPKYFIKESNKIKNSHHLYASL